MQRLRLFRVGLPLVHGFETSSHRKSAIDHVLVEATDADGAVGWGEIATPADPYFCSETTDTAWAVAIRHLIPTVVGADWETPGELERGWSRVRGHEFAKAGFSAAAWDLYARATGRSLAAALGGSRTTVAAGVSLGIEADVDSLLAQVQRHVAAGYARVKLKIAPGWDVAPVRAVRAAHPGLDLHVDANGAYPDTAASADVFRELDRHGLTMIEQPYAPRDFLAHARLQAKLQTPLCLDESVVEIADLQTMLALDAGRVLNIKVSRMGGLTTARRAHDVARDAGIPVWCGGMHEFGVGRAANVALSSLPGFTLPSDVSGSDKYYARDVIVPPVTARAGRVDVPTTPGLGHAVDTDWIADNASQRFDTAAAAV
ncbi:o-succinylbenzoate synthase [Microbacterium jiangjiandongii]|uniref:o-succinylbenzoate synthase n=1 Tax=Microbacterium jiangjiandongii TaxID=3049071 RepID=UPI00214B8737|nr:o-succinylbenzoate synthase [Microbacterium sp. zg.Y843]MCR2816390.1 o-succinylbenzoate synthase [Microbacterium sp. zg.Y843]